MLGAPGNVMPSSLRSRLCCQFAMGAALGALLAAALFASDSAISRMILHSEAPQLTAAVVVASVIAYCGIGATLSGFFFIITEDR